MTETQVHRSFSYSQAKCELRRAERVSGGAAGVSAAVRPRLLLLGVAARADGGQKVQPATQLLVHNQTKMRTLRTARFGRCRARVCSSETTAVAFGASWRVAARPGLGQKASASGDNGNLQGQKQTRWPENDVSEIKSTRERGGHRGPRAGAPRQAKIRWWLELRASWSWGWPARDRPQYGRGAGWKDSRACDPGKIFPKARSDTNGAHIDSRAGAPTQACSEALLKLIARHGLG